MSSLSETLTTKDGLARALRMPGERVWSWIGLGAVVALDAILNFANLAGSGFANHYYAAAVNAMLQSWHNFFFVAAEPGGSVSVDKPPFGFWLQAISAKLLGFNNFALLLPQLLAGILSVVVLYYLVRRRFGVVAGLLGGLALALTPIVIADNRNNTIDSTLVLTLLLAAWAFIKATETSKLRYLLLGALLVGVGFNIKMLQAYLPLPAFLALYFFGSKDRLLPKIGKLSLATVVLLVVSLSWATVVDLTPANQRPYVGSSTTNSELDLALGYNGIQRLIGQGGRGGQLSSLFGGQSSTTSGRVDDGGRGFPQGGFQPPAGQNGGTFPQGAPGGFGGGGPFNTGTPGIMRLFQSPLSKEASWLLPFALFGALLLALRSRIHWPVAEKHQAFILWGGWLITSAVFFSVAGFFHPYYLIMLAPPLAALVGIGAVEVWHLREKHPWISLALVALAGLATLAVQFTTASAYTSTMWWLPLVVGLFLIGVVLLIPLTKQKTLPALGLASLVAALLIVPAIWSGLTTMTTNGAVNLPEAYGGASAGGGFVNRDGGAASVNQSLVDYLQQNTPGMRYMLAVGSSQEGSGYVLSTGRGVLYLGGFSGQDQVETPASLSQLVDSGQLRYILLGGGRGFGGGQSSISSWVTSSCAPVQGVSTSNSGGFGGFGRGGTLYDCKG